MKKHTFFASSALCVLSLGMLLADPVYAQRGGRDGGGGNRGGGGGRGQSAGPQRGGGGGGANFSNRGGGGGNFSRGEASQNRGSVTVPRANIAVPNAGVQSRGQVDAQIGGQRIQSDVRQNFERRGDSNQFRGGATVERRDGSNQNRTDRDRSNWDRSNWSDFNRRGDNRDWDRDRDRDGDRDRDWDQNRDWNRNWNRNPWNNQWSYRNPYNNRYGWGYGVGGYGLGGYGIPGLGFIPGLGGFYNPYGGYGGYAGYWGRGYASPFGYYGNGLYGNAYAGNSYSGTVVDNTAVAPEAYVSTPAEGTGNGQEYLDQARAAFQNGDYAEAQRLANHAVIEMPDNGKAHEMMSLAMFAQGEFRGAAAAAHAAAHLGTVADWPTLYGYYNDRDAYATHLQRLQQSAAENANVPEIQFLLGVHQLMMGHKDSAKNQLATYLKLVRHDDPVGVRLFGDAGGNVDALPKPDPVAAPAEPESRSAAPAPESTQQETANPST